jgi:uncharacterized protein (TIGR04255 family)
VDFPPILSLDKANPPVKLQDEIKEEFPNLDTISGKFLEFKIDKDEPARLSETEVVKWAFSDKGKTKVVEVDQNSVTIEYLKYKDFNDYSEGYEKVLRKFFTLYNVVKISNRIGLRYINEIKIDKGNPFDWKNLINDDLVQIESSFIENKQNIKKSMHMLEVKGEGYDLKFQFGLYNSEYPNSIARKEFVLDYDCSLKEDIEINEIYDKAREFNTIISSWFERSIGESLREIMGKVKNE